MRTSRRKLIARLAATTLTVGVVGLTLKLVGVFKHDRLDEALIAAVKKSDAVTAIRLLRLGADPNSREVLADNRPMHKKLLDLFHGKYPAKQFGEPALILAFTGEILRPRTTQNVNLVNALLDAGADVNAREPRWGATAMIAAIEFKHLSTIETLLDHGADVNLRTNDSDAIVTYQGGVRRNHHLRGIAPFP